MYPGYESQYNAQSFGAAVDLLLNEDPGHAITNQLFDLQTVSLFLHDFAEASNLSPVLRSLAERCPNVANITIFFISDDSLVCIVSFKPFSC